MSRIHEALRKAERERAAAEPNVTAPLPKDGISIPEKPRETAQSAKKSVTAERSALPTFLGRPLSNEELQKRCKQVIWKPDPSLLISCDTESKEHGAEEFRTLRSRLNQIRVDGRESMQVILVTSPVSGEGKTFVSSNLAGAIARQQNRRVIVVDADLRCPRMHRQLGAPIEAGLTEYLSGEVDEFAIIQYSQNEKFFFIPSGMHVKTPSELISNGRLKNLIDFLRPNFDWIILDSPPCLPVADPTVLAEFCDGVLMIVRAESTPWETAQRACQEFRKEGFLGVVLNSVDPESTNGSYGYTLYNQYSDKSARS